MASCGETEFCDCFKDVSLCSVLSRWLLQITQMPFDPLIWLNHIGWCLVAWYILKFMFRLLLSLLWPLIVISFILLIIYSIQRTENGQLRTYLDEAFRNTYQSMAKFSKVLFKTAVDLITQEDGIGDFGKSTQRF